jgi:hypothetical protein
MKAQESQFSSIVETIYNLSLDDRVELKNLLEHNIAETRRNEIIDNFKTAQQEHKSGKLKFSSKITDLKKML